MKLDKIMVFYLVRVTLMRKHMVFLGFEQTAHYCDLPITILKWSYTFFKLTIISSKNSELISTNEINFNRASLSK